ncbi:MAG: hypothetical protein FD152_940 [Xanthobacteraceae bacterium]|nr:MAG: hypothetical protein FD152_940 [Xanthobacteraceae bacterium]
MTLILSPLFALFAASSLLAFSLNGLVAPPVVLAIAVLASGLVVHCIRRSAAAAGLSLDNGPDGRTIAALAGLSAAIIFLSGQAGVLYLNHDWQIRLPLLRDLAGNAWPIGYRIDGVDQVLRAQLGMFALPALVGDVGGMATSRAALVLQNATVLTLALALVAMLGRTRREQALLVAVVLAFSGMDAVGRTIVNLAKGGAFDFDHLETWAGIQFSSTITQLFWVPHHGLTGLIAAALYLLWWQGRLPPTALIAFVPLMAFWSPLSFLGALPFAAHAMVGALRDRRGLPWVVVAGAVSSLLAVYAIAFLQSGTDNLPFHIGFAKSPASTERWPTVRYAGFLAIEILAFVAVVAVARSWRPLTATPFVMAVGVLLICPLAWIGQGEDFVMRVSIPALNVLALLVARILIDPEPGPAAPLRRLARGVAVAALAIGAITPLMEIRRAFVRPLGTVSAACSVVDAWAESEWPLSQVSIYLADEARFPAALRPQVATRLVLADPRKACMEGSWRRS